jgi:hypothetical protein
VSDLLFLSDLSKDIVTRSLTFVRNIDLHDPTDIKMFKCMMVSVGWHCTVVIAYILWYIWQRRYSNAHFIGEQSPGDSQSTFQSNFSEEHCVVIRDLEYELYDASIRSRSPLSPTAAGFAFTPQSLYQGPGTGLSNHRLRACRRTSNTRAGDSFPGSQQIDLQNIQL